MNEKQKEWIRFHSNEGNARAAACYGLKGMEGRWNEGDGREEGGENARGRWYTKRKGTLSTPQKWAKFWRKVGSEKAEMATMPVGSFRLFFRSFFLRLLCLFSRFFLCSRCQLQDRRLKSRRATSNVITLILFHLRSICHLEQTHVNTFARGQTVGQPKVPKCDGLFAEAAVSRRKRLRGHLSRLVNRRGRDRVSHARSSLCIS